MDDGGQGKGENVLAAANMQLSEDDNVLVQGVVGSPYAIGYFGYAYYAGECRQAVTILTIEGVEPTRETVDDERVSAGAAAVHLLRRRRSCRTSRRWRTSSTST